MKLADAARFFDRIAIRDAYSSAQLFKGQFDLFDDSKRDGVTVDRRVLSIASGLDVPTRKAVMTPDGVAWLLGTDFPDYFNGDVIRRKFTAHRADDLAAIYSLSDVCMTRDGVSAFASRSWVKDTKEINESAGMFADYDIFFAQGEPVAPRSMIRMKNRWHLARSTYDSQAGYLVASSDELPEPVVTSAQLTLRTLDPVAETFATSDVNLIMILLRWQSGFEYFTQSALPFVQGDELGIIAAQAATPRANDLITVSGVARRVLEVNTLDDCFRMHLRRA